MRQQRGSLQLPHVHQKGAHAQPHRLFARTRFKGALLSALPGSSGKCRDDFVFSAEHSSVHPRCPRHSYQKS